MSETWFIVVIVQHEYCLGRSVYLWVSLFYLRLVFVAYGRLAWSFYLQLKFGLVFFAYSSPTVSKKRGVSKITSTVSKKDASLAISAAIPTLVFEISI